MCFRALYGRVGLLLAALALVLLGACQSETTQRPEPVEPSNEQAQPSDTAAAVIAQADGATVVARAAALTLSLDDYRLAIAKLQLLGYAPSPQQLADPVFQQATALRALRVLAARQLAVERELQLNDGALLAVLREHPKLREQSEAKSLSEALAVVSEASAVPVDEVKRIIEDFAVEQVLLARLREDVDDATLWSAYQAQQRRLSLRVVRLLNVPSSAEISDRVEQQPEQIAQYYRSHLQRYQQAERLELRRLLLPLATDATEPEQLACLQRAQELAQRARSGEDFLSLVRAHSVDPARVAKDGLMPPIEGSRFSAYSPFAPGEILGPQREAESVVLYRVERVLPALERELDASLQREIASLLIQAEGPAPSVLALAKDVAFALQAGDERQVDVLIANHPSDRFEFEKLQLPGPGRLPELGYVPRLRALLDAATSAPVVLAPLLDGEHVYVAQLLAVDEASRQRYASERELFRRRWLEQEEGRLLDALLAQRTGAQVSFQLRPVQMVYGVLRKDGTVMRLD
ncbi:MAG: hypothetical protein RBU37_00120 [Myxococcota bacterium]|nr:hypothetical protein [Myxococcota bacterium]